MLGVETVLGALTGYFTNDIAIRQLFAKDGVVVRERAQFTELIIRVLCEQIIDDEIVSKLREDEKVQGLLVDYIREWLASDLPYTLSGYTLNDFDKDGQMKAILCAHVENLDLSQVRLNSSLLEEKISALLSEPLFKERMAQALAAYAQMTPKDLRLDKGVQSQLANLEKMDSPEWENVVDNWETALIKAVRAGKQAEVRDFGALTLQDVLPFDGETVLSWMVCCLFPEAKHEAAHWLHVIKDQEFQERLYVFAERLLPEVLGQMLPTVAGALYAFFKEDRADIEMMLYESVLESDNDNPLFRDAAMKLLSQFFSLREEDKDWLTALYETYSQVSQAEALCKNISQFLLSWLVKEIDTWRQVAADDADAVARLYAHLLKMRQMLIDAIDWLLAQSMENIPWAKEAGDAVWNTCFALLKSLQAKEWVVRVLTKKLSLWMDRPLQESLLSENIQHMILEALQPYWQQNGHILLSQLNLSQDALKKGLNRTMERLFSMSLSQIICKSKDVLPYEKMAQILQQQIFTNLRPFLGNLTRDQLDALSHEEIRELVLDMIGREMRPLTILGGGVGALAGFATGALMMLGDIPAETDQEALLMGARTGMYGVVGYGTNVLAVQGLFRPYKKVLGFQGLMVKNQARFAEKMKEMTAAYVINDAIWREQMQQFAPTTDEIIAQGCQKILSKKAKFPELFAAANGDACVLLRNQGVRAAFSALAHSNLPAKLATAVLDQVDWKKRVAQGLPEDYLERFIASAEIPEHAAENIISKYLHSAQQKTAVQWTKAANNVLNKMVFPEDSAVYKCLWQRLLPYYKALPEWLQEQSNVILSLIEKHWLAKLPISLQLGYRLAGGRDFMQAVFTCFVSHKLPRYLFKSEGRVQEVYLNWAQSNMAGRSLSDCGVTLSLSEGAWIKKQVGAIQMETVLEMTQGRQTFIAAYQKGAMNKYLRAFAGMGAEILWRLHGQAMVKTLWAQVDREKMCHLLTPVCALTAKNLMTRGCICALLSLPEDQLVKQLDVLLTFNESESGHIAGAVMAFWRHVKPLLLAEVTKQGQALVLLVDIPDLVEKQILALSPQTLENMIRGIAQPYFVRVERMGWLGAVVAIPATVLSRCLGGI